MKNIKIIVCKRKCNRTFLKITKNGVTFDSINNSLFLKLMPTLKVDCINNPCNFYGVTDKTAVKIFYIKITSISFLMTHFIDRLLPGKRGPQIKALTNVASFIHIICDTLK